MKNINFWCDCDSFVTVYFYFDFLKSCVLKYFSYLIAFAELVCRIKKATGIEISIPV